MAHLQEKNDSLKQLIAEKDAETVREACSGIGTDEEQLIEVLCRRTKSQLERIDQVYRTKHDQKLWDEVEEEVGGNYKRMLKYALMERDEYVSCMMQDAFKGLGTKESLLFEVLVPLSNAEIEAAKEHWEGKHDQSLVDKVNEEMSGHLRKLIMCLVTGDRPEDDDVDEGLAEEQATQLNEAGVGKRFGTDDEVFVDIMGKSSNAQLQAVKAKYEEMFEMSLSRAIGKEFHGDMKLALRSLIETRRDLFCSQLRRACKGIGTDEHAVCRILGGCDKGRLMEINERFMEKYDMSVEALVQDELSGNFRAAVEAWIDPLGDPTKGVEQRLAKLEHGDRRERDDLLEEEHQNLKDYMKKLDAIQLRQACKGFGTNEDRVISILCNRNKAQLQDIDQAFRELYNMSIREQLEDDLGGDLKTFMIATLMESAERDAHQMRRAMEGIGTDEDVLIMVLTTRSNEEIAAARSYYEEHYDDSLVEKCSEEMSGHFGQLMLALLNGDRDESPEGDMDSADAQADTLHECGDPKATFVEIFSTVSRAQAACISEVYESKFDRSLASTISRKFRGNLEDALLSLAADPLDTFARGLKKAFHGIGTDEDALCRILAGNDKDTCAAISERFEQKYDDRLVDALKKDLDGTFENCVVTWITAIESAKEAEAFANSNPHHKLYGSQHGGRYDYDEPEPEEDNYYNCNEEPEDEPEVEPEEDEGFMSGLASAFGFRELPMEDGDEELEENVRQEREVEWQEAQEVENTRMKSRMIGSKKRANERKKRVKTQQRQKEFAKKVHMRSRRALKHVAAAKEIYGSDMITGLTVWGHWDSDLYMKHNSDLDPDTDAWEHFKSHGFRGGILVRIDNACGAFVGVLNMSAYAERHGIDTSHVNKSAPYELELVGWRHFLADGQESGLEIAICQVVPVYLFASFDEKRYAHKYSDVGSMTRSPHPGKFDGEGYRKLYPEVDAEGLDAFEHYSENRENKICIRGAVGLPHRRWYEEQYGAPYEEHFFDQGYAEGAYIMIKPGGVSPMGHFRETGFSEGRSVQSRTAIGEFNGVFDEANFVELNPEAGDSGMDPLEYYQTEGRESGAKFPLMQIKMLRVDATALETDRNFDDMEGTDDSDDDTDEYTVYEVPDDYE